jgi:ADP-ribosyl-[dinitrogen reductase] hydrolase
MLDRGCPPAIAGGMGEHENGNGSLIRILPILWVVHDLPILERYAIIKDVSSITHAHFRSVAGCFIYIEYLIQLMAQNDRKLAYQAMQQSVLAFFEEKQFNPKEIAHYDRVLKGDISQLPKSEIKSEGYVVYTLEASFWCFLNGKDYAGTVLEAVNLGGDTDTTGAVAGGLAGFYWGKEAIPAGWWDIIAKKTEIEGLLEKVFK